MLEITRKALVLEPSEVMELERILIDEDQKSAIVFLKKSIFQKLIISQENKLKSHLDGANDPAAIFGAKNK